TGQITRHSGQAITSGTGARPAPAAPAQASPPAAASQPAAPAAPAATPAESAPPAASHVERIEGGPPAAELGERAGQMVGERHPPVSTVVSDFWGAVEEYFSSGDGMSFDQLAAKMGDAWESMKSSIESFGGELAQKLVGFFTGGEAEGKLGESLGWLAGSLAF